MKVLLDECLPVDLRLHLPGHEVHTVDWAGFKSKKNGELLRASERAGYSVLLTIDSGIGHQQNLSTRNLTIIIIRARTNQIEDLLPFVDRILLVLDKASPGQVILID